MTKENIFSKYLNPVFVETGTCDGDGVQSALDAGFKDIYSIELSPDHYDFCMNRYKDKPNVHLVFGDSRIDLWNIIKDINNQITFWLDAHYYEDSVCALPQELDAIGRHPIKTHTIMIDDLRDLGRYGMGLSVEVLMGRILIINPDYMFAFEDGYAKKDILIAKII